MLYSGENGNTNSFRGKTWQLTNGYTRGCNHKGQQCTFKTKNEALRFAKKDKPINEALSLDQLEKKSIPQLRKMQGDVEMKLNKAKASGGDLPLTALQDEAEQIAAAIEFKQDMDEGVVNETLQIPIYAKDRKTVLGQVSDKASAKKVHDIAGGPSQFTKIDGKEAWVRINETVYDDTHRTGKYVRELNVVNMMAAGAQPHTYKIKQDPESPDWYVWRDDGQLMFNGDEKDAKRRIWTLRGKNETVYDDTHRTGKYIGEAGDPHRTRLVHMAHLSGQEFNKLVTLLNKQGHHARRRGQYLETDAEDDVLHNTHSKAIGTTGGRGAFSEGVNEDRSAFDAIKVGSRVTFRMKRHGVVHGVADRYDRRNDSWHADVLVGDETGIVTRDNFVALGSSGKGMGAFSDRKEVAEPGFQARTRVIHVPHLSSQEFQKLITILTKQGLNAKRFSSQHLETDAEDDVLRNAHSKAIRTK